MHTNSNHSEELNALERRLSAWQPDSAGLDVDAMLFAAGRASVRPGPARFVWPAVTGVLAALSVVLSLWLADERNERLILASRLRERPPVPAVSPSLPPADNPAVEETPHSDEPAPNSFLASRRALEKGLDAWPSRIEVRGGPPDPSTDPPVLRLGQRDALLEP